jgi:hypothetical protein
LKERVGESGMKILLKTAAMSLGLMACMAQVSQAAFVFAEWNTITGGNTVDGTLNGVAVTYSGQVAASTQVGNTGIQYWTEYAGHALPYTPVTGTLPTRTDIVTLSDVGTHTITFATPVWDPVMLICSLGAPGNQVTYTFNQPATVLSSGWSYWNQVTGNPGSLLNSGNQVVVGQEGAGVIGFSGLVSSITWTTDKPEYWHGITLATAVPEPTTMIAGALLLLPFGASTIRILRKKIAA